jgi:hypothetical protein
VYFLPISAISSYFLLFPQTSSAVLCTNGNTVQPGCRLSQSPHLSLWTPKAEYQVRHTIHHARLSRSVDSVGRLTHCTVEVYRVQLYDSLTSSLSRSYVRTYCNISLTAPFCVVHSSFSLARRPLSRPLENPFRPPPVSLPPPSPLFSEERARHLPHTRPHAQRETFPRP